MTADTIIRLAKCLRRAAKDDAHTLAEIPPYELMLEIEKEFGPQAERDLHATEMIRAFHGYGPGGDR